MPFALVGTAGVFSSGAAGAALTPAWGTSENRTVGNLLVLQVLSWGAATLPGAISGWTIGKQQAGTSMSVSCYYKVAAGADAAPTVPVVTSVAHGGRLLEFSGGWPSAPIDQTAGISGTTTPLVATCAAVDALAGALVVATGASLHSATVTSTMAHTINNGVADVEANNNAQSNTAHYNFTYGTTNVKTAASSSSMAYTVTSITGAALAVVTFKVMQGNKLLVVSG